MGIRLLPWLGEVGWPSAGFHALHDLGVAAAAEVPHQPQERPQGRSRARPDRQRHPARSGSKRDRSGVFRWSMGMPLLSAKLLIVCAKRVLGSNAAVAISVPL